MQIGSECESFNKQKKFHFDNQYMDNPRSYESIVLYQIGDLNCEGGYNIGDHKQCCYEISYIVSGSGYYYTDGKPYTVKQGDIYLSLPGEPHDGLANASDPFRFFYAGFDFSVQSDETHSLSHIKKMFH